MRPRGLRVWLIVRVGRRRVRIRSVEGAQAALDVWVEEYNCHRPHQALDMQAPADRFTLVPLEEREVLGLKVPGALSLVPQQRTALPAAPATVEPVEPVPAVVAPEASESPVVRPQELVPVSGGPVEFERVVPASGNLQVAGKQFWLGPARAGLTVTFWADTSVIHLLIAGARIKTVRSHLSVADLFISTSSRCSLLREAAEPTINSNVARVLGPDLCQSQGTSLIGVHARMLSVPVRRITACLMPSPSCGPMTPAVHCATQGAWVNGRLSRSAVFTPPCRPGRVLVLGTRCTRCTSSDAKCSW